MSLQEVHYVNQKFQCARKVFIFVKYGRDINLFLKKMFVSLFLRPNKTYNWI